MILDKLNLIEVSNLETHFWMIDKPQGEGSVDVKFGQLSFEAGATLSSEIGKSAIIVSTEPKIVGVEKSDRKEAFSLSIKMKMIFSYPSEEDVNENTIKDYGWYFSSFARTHFRIFAEQILQQAGINGVSLPLN